jgi:two-component system sensor histidine kinase AlgZ
MGNRMEKELRQDTGGVYPPTFCHWRLLLVVVLITELSVILISLGKNVFPDWRWIGLTSIYAQWLALFCASGLCITSAWTGRLSAKGAWVASWVIAVVLAVAFSFASWYAAPYLRFSRHDLPRGQFIFESPIAQGLVTVALFRYLLVRARWRAELIAQAEARVQALQARIRPHFLFNSLNTVASLIPVDPVSAEASVLDLADIFRGSMRRADQPISLSEELNLARQYLDMEQRRLGDRLEVTWRVEELPDNASVLPLMLQPLLENAVTHGIQCRKDGGALAIYGRGEGDKVVVTIVNPIAPAEYASSGHGMAIENIRERLQLAYGPRSSLVTYEDDEQYYVVLTLPFIELN